jgi:hypothetical protein
MGLLHLIVSDNPPPTDGTDWTNFAWLDTKNAQLKVYDGEWKVIASVGSTGYSGEIKHGNDTMTFENGILVKYTGKENI